MSEIIFGLHAVQAALQKTPDSITELFILKGRRDKRMQVILNLCDKQKIHYREISRYEMTEKTGNEHHQGVMAYIAKPTKTYHENDLEYLIEKADKPLLLILDGVQDPHNLGAALRSADGAGVTAVIIPKDRAASITPTVKKVACGAAETMPLISVTNLSRTLEKLKQAGIWLYGLAGETEKSFYDLDLTGPVGLVLGAEGKGLRQLTKTTCDELVYLPMHGSVSSLNVSVSTGIVLYECVRQRLN